MSRFSLLNLPDKMSIDAAGNLLIGDRNNHRARAIAFGTGIIDTLMGDGSAGSLGDGLPARGVHLILTGPGFVQRRIPVLIQQSQWQILSLSNSQTMGTPFNFQIDQNADERMAVDTTVNLTALSPFTLTTPITISVNTTRGNATGTPTAPGSGAVRVEANGTRFNSVTSPTITVLPIPTAPMSIDDNLGARVDTATGVRRQHYVRLPANAGSGGVTHTVLNGSNLLCQA